MNLRLVREPTIDGATLGCLFVDGHFECFTLEDAIRETLRPISGGDRDVADVAGLGAWVASWKVPGQTAIPSGRYRVIVTPSPHFQRPLPMLLDVPGFSGIRMHPGNTVGDTEGCLLVGRDRRDGRVLQSVQAFAALLDRMRAATGEIWIAIENPVEAR